MFYENAHSTMLTMLRHAAGSNLELRQNALEQFCTIYSQPLVDFLRATKKLDCEDAEEVVQSFWSERFFRKGDPSHFVVKFLEKRNEHPELSFRKYLARSLANHAISLGRRKTREHEVSLETIEGWEPLANNEQDVFDVAWANHLLARVLDEVRRECELKDQLSLWQLFDAQALQPALTGAPALGYAKLAQQFGFRSPKAASNAMQTVARKFNRVFVEIIRDYLPSQESELTQEVVDKELHKLLSVLSKAGALKLNRLESQEDSWLKGYSVAMEQDSIAGFEFAKLADQKMFVELDDMEVAWNDVRQLPLADWLFAVNSEDSMSQLSLALVLTEELASVDTYDRIRSQAKLAGNRKSHESPTAIPQEFYATTYLLAIVAADLFCGIRISTQHQSAIAGRAATVRQSEWLDEASKELLAEYTRRFV